MVTEIVDVAATAFSIQSSFTWSESIVSDTSFAYWAPAGQNAGDSCRRICSVANPDCRDIGKVKMEFLSPRRGIKGLRGSGVTSAFRCALKHEITALRIAF